MSNRQRGGKTLSAEDEIIADSVDIVGTGLKFSGNGGQAGQVLQVDTDLSQKFQNLVIQNDSITGDMLADNITITTTGDITANEIKTGIISNNNNGIVINETISLGANKDINLNGTGGISIPVGSILAGAGNIKTTAGQVHTNTIDTTTTGQNLTTRCNLVLDSGKSITLSGTGTITTAHNIETTAGEIITSIIEHPTPGNTISFRGNLAMNTDKALSLAGTGGITLAGTGNIVIGAGELRITNMNNSAGNGGVITSNGSIALANGKNLSLGGVGAINTGAGSITTGTGDLVSGGAVITDVLDTQTTGQNLTTRCNLVLDADKSITLSGTGTITTAHNIETTAGEIITSIIEHPTPGNTISFRGNLAMNTDKALSLAGTGGITLAGTGNIVATSGEVHTNTIDTPVTGQNLTCKGTLIMGSGKHIESADIKIDAISHRTAGNIIALMDDILGAANQNITLTGTGALTTATGNISTTSGDITINSGTGGKVQADEVKCDVISNRNAASNLQIADDLVFANDKSITTSGTGGTGLFGGNLSTAGNLSATGFISLAGLSTSDPSVNNQVWVDTNGILRLSGTGSGGGGGGGIPVSKIDLDSGHYYLQFFSTDGFTCPADPRPALHPNEINDITIAPEIDGWLAMTEGETIIFTGKIPVGWVGTAIKFGLLNDHGGGGTGPFVLSGNTNNCRVSIKSKFLPTASKNTEVFNSNTAHLISAPNHLINTIDDMVVIEITDIESEHNKAYTAGGWIRIEPDPSGGG